MAIHVLKERGLDQLDDDLRRLVEKLQALMDTSGLEDPGQEGLWMVKARKLGELERSELSQVVDELAFWFGDKA